MTDREEAGIVSLIIVILFVTTFQVVDRVPREEETEIIEATETLPDKCREYYANGTDQWIECIGVGRK